MKKKVKKAKKTHGKQAGTGLTSSSSSNERRLQYFSRFVARMSIVLCCLGDELSESGDDSDHHGDIGETMLLPAHKDLGPVMQDTARKDAVAQKQ